MTFRPSTVRSLRGNDDKRERDISPLRPHDLRHAFAFRLLQPYLEGRCTLTQLVEQHDLAYRPASTLVSSCAIFQSFLIKNTLMDALADGKETPTR